MSTPRNTGRVAALFVAAVALTACRDAATAPQAASRAPQLAKGGLKPVANFTIDPRVDNVLEGADGYRIVIPANAICERGRSGYGPEVWDAPCAPATNKITFTISASKNQGGRPRVDITPDVRFSPSKSVVLYLSDAEAARAARPVIEYCATAKTCVDESRTDPSVRTYANPAAGTLSRRLKHFSGYHVILGFGGDDTQEQARARHIPNVLGASGYITTTGLQGTSPEGFSPDGRIDR
jgi:hypothetical protein